MVEICADDLGGPQLALFHFAQMNEVRAGLAGFELGLVTAGGRLCERHQFAFAFRIHDHGLQVKEVSEIAVGVDGLDADDASALFDRDIG